MIALVHLTRSGKTGDPMRPDFAPAEASKDRTGILAWSYQLTDDKTLAIVHYVSAQRAAIEPIVSDKRPDPKFLKAGSTAVK